MLAAKVMFQIKKSVTCIIFFFVLLTSCNELAIKEKYPTIPGYHLENPTTISLKTELDEISGVVFYPKDTSVFAINDELGKLYKIYIRKKIEIKDWKFSNDADYEDLALVDSTFYAMHSNGNLSRFKIYSADSFVSKEVDLPISGKNEFEALYYDDKKEKLILLCKDCNADKKEVSAYAYDTKTNSFSSTPLYSIDSKMVLNKLPKGEKQYKPSAAAIHPITGELYIVSAVNKSIVIADTDGNIKNVFPVNPAIFKQPEGLTFTPNGDLVISNEAAETGAGNILIFKYKKH